MAELAPAGAVTAGAAQQPSDPARRSPAIEVRDLEKTFRIPTEQIHTLKERALHPFRRTRHQDLHVLRGISFDVMGGEFFGIVGRNGSGKSTLLKCLAGIYRADAGHLRVAGRLSPFIELGVGFNPDLTARDNVVINAVMMGLTPREARARFDAIVDFAELRDFVDLKLKNYSSGMQVRLAFAVMVQSGADVLLIDEVLAVGDVAFQQRCFDEFVRLRREGRTIVLVTHDMPLVQRFCHRALLITNGEIETIGDPGSVGERYLKRNYEATRAAPGAAEDGTGGLARVADVWVENDAGMRVERTPHGKPMHLHALIEVDERVHEPIVDFWVDDADGARVFATSTRGWPEAPAAEPGEQLHVTVTVENLLRSGRYHIGCSLLSGGTDQRVAALSQRQAAFVVYAGNHVFGLVHLDHELTLDRERTS